MALALRDFVTTEIYLDKPPSIGQRIKELRLARGWALDRLARETGLSRGTIWEAESRKNRVPFHVTLSKIAEAFEVPVEYLRDGKLPAQEASLSDFSPEMYGRAQGIRNPRHLNIIRETVQTYQRLEALEAQCGDEVEDLAASSDPEAIDEHMRERDEENDPS